MHRSAPLALIALSALTLAGCAATPAASDGKIQVVASTSVYGSIVEQIGGDHVDVTSLISSAAQDPHEYEPSSKDKLLINRADLVVSNGGGYDGFIAGLITSDDLPVIEAVDFASDYPGNDEHDDVVDDAHAHDDETAAEHAEHDDATEDAHTDDATEDAHTDDAAEVADGHDDHAGHNHIAGFNEHVWYDPAVIAGLATDVAEHLGELDPENAATYAQNAEALHAELDTLTDDIAAVAATQPHTHILVTEPVALRLTDLMGLHNSTPSAFLEAVEEGQDVAPATLLETLKVLEDDGIAAVIANTQTGGNETERIIDEAEAANIPVLEFAEVLPDGLTYVEWMAGNIDTLADALGAAS